MKLAPCHLYGALNFEVYSRFFGKLLNPPARLSTDISEKMPRRGSSVFDSTEDEVSMFLGGNL